MDAFSTYDPNVEYREAEGTFSGFRFIKGHKFYRFGCMK